MKKNILLIFFAISLSGCGVFSKYAETESVPDDVFGTDETVLASSGENSFGDLGWKELFSDPCLQTLIDSALVRNTDLFAARLQIQQAEETLKSAKLGYLPSLYVNPSFALSSESAYNIPISLDWGGQGFGSITARKRHAQVMALQAADVEQTVRSQLIASVAEAYYQLQTLDRQYEIISATEIIWQRVLETQKALMENGKAYSVSVDQMESSLIGVVIQKKDILNQINETETALCLLLAQTPRKILRSSWGNYEFPAELGIGVPANLLERRPDVRAAGHEVEQAYYMTCEARAQMLPNLSLSGLAGWTNAGMALSDPAKFVYEAVVSLMQPVFSQGKLRANLKISELAMKAAAKDYSQTVLAAGKEVNNALKECQLAREKDELYKRQVSVLQNAHDATIELMNCGKASYIEVLIAQQNLLQAQLSEALNLYDGATGVINLYISLGGGI